MSTVRSGWIEKQTGTIFKSWKKKYAVLYKDGEFSLYDGPTDATADTRIHMRKECKDISVGFECGCTNLPKGQTSIDALFCIKTKGGKEHYLAASSDNECRQWVGALQQARIDQTGFRQTVAQAPPIIPDAPPMYEQHVSGGPPPYTAGGPVPAGYVAAPMQGPPGGYYAPQPGVMYVRQPVYVGQPGYGPQPYQVQRQQTGDNSTRNMLIGAAAGGLAGYAMGSMLTHSMHGWGHHDYGGFDHGGFDHGGFDGGGFDGGGFDGGGFDF